MSEDLLVCPGCAANAAGSERFCPACGLPLVFGSEARAAQPSLSRSQEQARKVKPQYTEGALVKAVGAHNQTEAEFIQGLLLEEGIPSVLRRSAGFDVPDFLAAGPRDVMVAQSAAGSAYEVLLQGELISPHRDVSQETDSALKIIVGLTIALAVVAIIILLHP